MTALRTKLAEDLQAHFDSIFGAPMRPGMDADDHNVVVEAEEAPAENVVRPAIFNRAPAEAPVVGRARPELAAALTTVTRATEAFREAEQQADRRAQRAIDIAFRSMAQVEAFEEKLVAARAAVDEVTRRGEEEARRLQAEIEERESRLDELEGRIAALLAQSARQEVALREEAKRADLAEAHAAESISDLRYLAAKVSEALGVPVTLA